MRKTIVLLALAGLLAAPAAFAQAGNVSRLPGKTQHAPPPSAEQRMGKLDHAGRVQLLREADYATRKAFAAYQAALAKAKDKGDASGVDAVLAINPDTAPRAAIKAVGDDMSNAALDQQEATHATRNTFQKFTAALDEEAQLEGAAGPDVVVAAFGVEAQATTADTQQ